MQVVAINVAKRTFLSPAERALHVAKRKELYEKAHPETKHGAVGRGRKKSRQNGDSIAERFTADTAEKTGRSERSVQRDAARAKITGLADIVGTSLDIPDELDALAKLPEQVQHDLIEKAKAGEKVTARHTAKKLHRDERERDLAAATEAAAQTLGQRLAGVIYTDEPTAFETWSPNGKTKSADNHYPTMSLDEIKALPIPAADDCVILSWATVPMLPQALEVMAARGFTYKSALFWIKDKAGTGYWTRNRVEILLIGTKGNVPAPSPGAQPPQVIEAPRGKHSEKPAIFAEIIEKMFPNVPKLEMFARTARPGWDVWGNEAPPPDQSPPTADDLSIPQCLRREPVSS